VSTFEKDTIKNNIKLLYVNSFLLFLKKNIFSSRGVSKEEGILLNPAECRKLAGKNTGFDRRVRFVDWYI